MDHLQATSDDEMRKTSSTVGRPQPSDSASPGAIFLRNHTRAKVHNRL